MLTNPTIAVIGALLSAIPMLVPVVELEAPNVPIMGP